MLIHFKSAASGDVLMFEKNAKELLAVLGKNPDDGRGVVTVEQLPAAIASIKLAMESSQTHTQSPTTIDAEIEDSFDGSIRLHQRARPFLELLERSLQDEVPVTWGV